MCAAPRNHAQSFSARSELDCQVSGCHPARSLACPEHTLNPSIQIHIGACERPRQLKRVSQIANEDLMLRRRWAERDVRLIGARAATICCAR